MHNGILPYKIETKRAYSLLRFYLGYSMTFSLDKKSAKSTSIA